LSINDSKPGASPSDPSLSEKCELETLPMEAMPAPSPEVSPSLTNPTSSEIDLFDPARLRLAQDFATTGVKKLLTTVPVRKPNRQAFVRVRGGEGWRLVAPVLELRDEGETYMVDPSVRDELALETTPKILFTAIDRQGVLFLWPVRLPRSDGRWDNWSRSAQIAAEKAEHKWVRVVANLDLGAYEVFEASAPIPEPDWPEVDFRTILKTAFGDRYIDNLDHPVVRRLRGKS
jgi:hypothetical protein